jgi:hypothetical protein
VSELTEDVEGPTLTAYELQRVDWFEELGFDLAAGTGPRDRP